MGTLNEIGNPNPEDVFGVPECEVCGYAPGQLPECRVCGCNEYHPCTLPDSEPCAWENFELCTACADLHQYIRHWSFQRGECDAYCGRPAPGRRQDPDWGNPFSHRDLRRPGLIKVETPSEAVVCYRSKWILQQPDLLRSLKGLQGKILGCFCKTPQNPLAPCHCEVLALMANRSHLALCGELERAANG